MGYGAPSARAEGSPSVAHQRQISSADPKGVLQQILQAFIGRSQTKDDMPFATQEKEGGGYVATVTFPATQYNAEGYVFEGEGPTRQDAEKAAAKAGVDELMPLAQPVIEEKKRMKELAESERRAAKRLKTEEDNVGLNAS